jgi:hypothetical protein
MFSHLQQDISDTLLKFDINQKEAVEGELLKVVLEASQKAVLQGTTNIFQAHSFFCYLLYFGCYIICMNSMLKNAYIRSITSGLPSAS